MTTARRPPIAAAQSGLRSETVRSANLSTILRGLHLRGPLSRSELGALTGLTRSSIGALVNELVRLDLAVDRGTIAGGGRGRPSAVAAVAAGRNVVLAVQVAVDSLAVASVGLGGELRMVVRRDRTRDRVDLQVTIDDLVEMCNQVRTALPGDCRVHGIGVGVVGLVRRADNSITVAPNLGWHEVPFGALLGSALGDRLAVHVANDADVSALAELHRGVAVGVAEVLSVWGEVGVGGGIVSRGELITGDAGFAGEVGHIPVNPGGLPCGCGSIGCWETEVGEAALLRRAGLPVDGGPPAIETLLKRAAAGDAVTLAALQEEARWLGIGLAGLINVLNPGMVVLGGLFGRIHEYTAAAVGTELERRALSSARAELRVVPSLLGADAPLLGAAELAFEHLLADPQSVAPFAG